MKTKPLAAHVSDYRNIRVTVITHYDCQKGYLDPETQQILQPDHNYVINIV